MTDMVESRVPQILQIPREIDDLFATVENIEEQIGTLYGRLKGVMSDSAEKDTIKSSRIDGPPAHLCYIAERLREINQKAIGIIYGLSDILSRLEI